MQKRICILSYQNPAFNGQSLLKNKTKKLFTLTNSEYSTALWINKTDFRGMQRCDLKFYYLFSNELQWQL